MDETGLLVDSAAITNALMILAACVAVLIIAYFCYRVVRAGLMRLTTRSFARWTARFAGYLIFLLGLYLIDLWFLGFNITALIASLGIISIALAFASQQIISSLLAGILIAFNRTILLDDWVEVGGLPETGLSQVKDITFTRTILKARDGRVYIVPNATLLSSKIVNYSKSGHIEVSLPISLPSTLQFDEARKVILSVLAAHGEILPNGISGDKQAPTRAHASFFFQGYTWFTADPAALTPGVLLTGMTEDAIKISVRFWIRDVTRREEIVSAVLAEVLRLLEARGRL